MNIGLPFVIGVALVQGAVLHLLHRLADGDYGVWSELIFLLPAYAFSIGAPLTFYLLRTRLSAQSLATAVAIVALVLVSTAAFTGWVNGPVAEFKPDSVGSVVLYAFLTTLAWFIALPFLRFGLRGSLMPERYPVLFDEAWRFAITLAFAALFVGVFWGLLSLFVGLFKSIGIQWPEEIIFKRYFVYPATTVAAGFAIALTDVKAEMYRGLNRLLHALLRWLTVLAAAIVLLFLGAIVVEGVEPLWETRYAAAGLIGLSLALITLYNTIYEDGVERNRPPAPLAWLVRAALILGPALAVLALWALALRFGQHGITEDRLYALLVVTILAGYLVGYCVVAVRGAKSPFEIRHVNVAMALFIIAALVLTHTPVLDFKRIAVASQMSRLDDAGEKFDYRYLRHEAGRHGIVALQGIANSETAASAGAKTALAEANRRQALAEGAPLDKARFLSRIEVYPSDRQLPEDLIALLYDQYRKQRWSLWCIDSGLPCTALLIDLDHDGSDEAVVPLFHDGRVYARQENGWVRIGTMNGSSHDLDKQYQALKENRLRVIPPPKYSGIDVGAEKYTFAPERCATDDKDCAF